LPLREAGAVSVFAANSGSASMQKNAMKTLYVHWHGPFRRKDIGDNGLCGEDDPFGLEGHGLYALIGKQARKKTKTLQYIGITDRKFYSRFKDPGHAIDTIPRELSIWIGKIVYGKSDRSTLEDAEYMFIHFSEPVLNEKKTRM
jgi:hypothetical protein